MHWKRARPPGLRRLAVCRTVGCTFPAYLFQNIVRMYRPLLARLPGHGAVFTAIAACFALRERMDLIACCGAALIFAGTVLAPALEAQEARRAGPGGAAQRLSYRKFYLGVPKMKRFILSMLALALAACAFACTPAAPAVEPTLEPTPEATMAPTPEATADTASYRFQYTAPEGFTVDSTNENLYYAPDYPNDASNINLVVTASDPALTMQLYTSDMLKAALDQSLTQAFNETVSIEMDLLEYTEIAGQSALHTVFHYTVSGIEIVTAQYVINAGASSCTIALAQMPGSDWMDAFDASVAAIVLTPEA